MKQLLGILALWLGLFCTPSFADTIAPQTPGQVKLDLLKQLERDGYLSQKLAQEAKEKYVDPKELAVVLVKPEKAASSEPSFFDRYVTWTNFGMSMGILVLLVWFSAFIGRFALGVLFLFAQVPKELYQALFLGFTLTLTLVPELLWSSHAFYLALFGAFANVILIGWIVDSHPDLQETLAKLFNFGVPPLSVVSFWGMLYFVALALKYQSQIFGFFAAVCLSGILSFAMYYRPGLLLLHVSEKGAPAVVWGHLVVLVAYCAMKVAGTLPSQAGLFAIGLQYYCTIAMGVGFLVAASPFGRDRRAAGYVMLFIAVFVLAITGYHIYDLKVIGSIISVFAVLLALEWIGYLSYRAGFLVGTFVTGIVLFGGSFLMESFASFLVLRLA